MSKTKSPSGWISEVEYCARREKNPPRGAGVKSAAKKIAAAARLPGEAAARKAVPLVSGVLDYFPDALAAVAYVSKVGNEQHNPGQPLHWARGKSTDEADCILRHLVDRGTVDVDGLRHSAKVAWRALALLQKELEEAEGLPLPRGCTVD